MKFCVCPAIHLYQECAANVTSNTLTHNDIGVEILNNASMVKDNTIENSHDNGLKVLCHGEQQVCTPTISGNRVSSSKYNGILVMGESSVSPCSPVIQANQVDNNRKAGIKVCEGA